MSTVIPGDGLPKPIAAPNNLPRGAARSVALHDYRWIAGTVALLSGPAGDPILTAWFQ